MYGGARLAQDVRSGAFDRFRGLPIWRGAFVLGGLLGDGARYLFASAIVLTLGLIMGYRPDGGASGVLAVVALVVVFGLSLSLLWAAVALAVHHPAVVISIANAVRRTDPARVRQQHLRPAPVHARLAPGLCRRQRAQPCGDGGPGPDERRRPASAARSPGPSPRAPSSPSCAPRSRSASTASRVERSRGPRLLSPCPSATFTRGRVMVVATRPRRVRPIANDRD